MQRSQWEFSTVPHCVATAAASCPALPCAQATHQPQACGLPRHKGAGMRGTTWARTCGMQRSSVAPACIVRPPEALGGLAAGDVQGAVLCGGAFRTPYALCSLQLTRAVGRDGLERGPAASGKVAAAALARVGARRPGASHLARVSARALPPPQRVLRRRGRHLVPRGVPQKIRVGGHCWALAPLRRVGVERGRDARRRTVAPRSAAGKRLQDNVRLV
jgi:hypothetical protein